MRERKFICEALTVRTILAGRQKAVRLPLPDQPEGRANLRSDPPGVCPGTHERAQGCTYEARPSPLGEPGDRLWVAESWAVAGAVAGSDDPVREGMRVVYKADGVDGYSWRSPAVMPKWASRLTLEIESVRLHRLQELTEADARDAGVVCVLHPDNLRCGCLFAKHQYRTRWDDLHYDRAPWDSNPVVWALTFRRV